MLLQNIPATFFSHPPARQPAFQMYGYLAQLEIMALLSGGKPTLATAIRRYKSKLESEHVRLVVMGEGKRGKSSLLNALLGAHFLPVSPVSATRRSVRIMYAPSFQACVPRDDGQKLAVDLPRLHSYLLEKEDKPDKSRVDGEATLMIPADICRYDMDLVDTPGLNYSASGTEAAWAATKEADAVLLVISARSPFSATECDLVCRLVRHTAISHLISVVTFLDQLDATDKGSHKFLAYVAAHMRKTVSDQLQREGGDPVLTARAHSLLETMPILGFTASPASMCAGDQAPNSAFGEDTATFRAFLGHIACRIWEQKAAHIGMQILPGLFKALQRDLPSSLPSSEGENALKQSASANSAAISPPNGVFPFHAAEKDAIIRSIQVTQQELVRQLLISLRQSTA